MSSLRLHYETAIDCAWSKRSETTEVKAGEMFESGVDLGVQVPKCFFSIPVKTVSRYTGVVSLQRDAVDLFE